MTTGLSPHARALLDAPNYAHLATVARDGSPRSVVVWVSLEGDRILTARKYTGEPYPWNGPGRLVLVVEPERTLDFDLPFTHRPG